MHCALFSKNYQTLMKVQWSTVTTLNCLECMISKQEENLTLQKSNTLLLGKKPFKTASVTRAESSKGNSRNDMLLQTINEGNNTFDKHKSSQKSTIIPTQLLEINEKTSGPKMRIQDSTTIHPYKDHKLPALSNKMNFDNFQNRLGMTPGRNKASMSLKTYSPLKLSNLNKNGKLNANLSMMSKHSKYSK